MQPQCNFQVCRPRTSDHRRAVQWLASLTRSFDTDPAVDPDVGMSLSHSMQFYSVYAETGDERYLRLSEDFLRIALATPAPR